MTERIGFVGVGRMGANMARRLKECGYPVVLVHDAHRPSADALAQELGCRAAASLEEVTEASDAIITVVSDDAAMRRIFAPPSRADSLLRCAKGKLFINCATISPGVHIEVERACKKAGAASLEACMASSITQAREGKLYLMCAGDAKTFERARPLLEKLSASMRYIGRTVNGNSAQASDSIHQLLRQFHFMLTNCLDAACHDVSNPGAETGDSGTVHGATLELVRKVLWLDLEFRTAAGSPAPKRLQVFHAHAISKHQPAGSLRTQQSFMSGKCQ